MLVLTRKVKEAIVLCDKDKNVIAKISVIGARSDRIQLGLDAPVEVTIYREEIYERVARNRQADA